MNRSDNEENQQKQDLKNQDNIKAENPPDSLNTTESRVRTSNLGKKKGVVLTDKRKTNKIKKSISSTENVGPPNKFDKLFGENAESVVDFNVQETIELPVVNPKSTHLRKSVTIKKSSKFSDDFEDEVEIEDDDEYVWVEEEIEEEVEVETDEEEIDEENIEEVSEEEETLRKEIEKNAKEEQELGEEEYVEEVPEELEIEEETQMKQEISDAEVEESLEEEKEEKEEIPKKKARTIKFVKIIKMVKKRKKDVLSNLQQKAEMKDEEYEKFKQKEAEQEEIKKKIDEELKQKEEVARKEREEKMEVVKNLLNELILLKKKNRALSRGIIDYYRSRKTENPQETEPPSADLLNRYNKRLKLFYELKKAVSSEIVRMNEELIDLQQEVNEANEACESGKSDLLTWIAEIGKDVIITQTGKPLEESIIQHLVQRLDVIIGQIREQQLIQLSLSNQMTENEAALKDLVAFEGNLSLIDYEQLRMDNQIFSEKIEERDNELAHLRKRVLEIIHTSAHVLEKTDAIAEDIERYNNQVVKMNNEMSALRRKVTKLKTTRDQLRSETSKMRKEAGLLTRPKLALDYEQSDLKIIEARNKMESLVKKFKKQKLIIENLRKDITDAHAFYDLF